MFRIPAVTKSLLIANFLCFFAMLGLQSTVDLNNVCGLHFFMAPDFHIYQLFTYMFMHGGWGHILSNMFALWMFGCVVEQIWGGKKFLFYYLSCGVGAGLFQEAAQYISYVTQGLANYQYVTIPNVGNMPVDQYLNLWTTVGASGAIFAVLLAFGMLLPNERIFIFPLPVPIKAKYFVMGYAAFELYMGLSQPGDSVAHIAHLGGMVFGYFMIRHWNKQQGQYGKMRGHDAFSKVKDVFGGRNRRDDSAFGGNGGSWSFGGCHKEEPKTEEQKDWDYNARKKAEQDEIDRILDKIRKSGYDSLTKEEKQKLFDQSK